MRFKDRSYRASLHSATQSPQPLPSSLPLHRPKPPAFPDCSPCCDQPVRDSRQIPDGSSDTTHRNAGCLGGGAAAIGEGELWRFGSGLVEGNLGDVKADGDKTASVVAANDKGANDKGTALPYAATACSSSQGSRSPRDSKAQSVEGPAGRDHRRKEAVAREVFSAHAHVNELDRVCNTEHRCIQTKFPTNIRT